MGLGHQEAGTQKHDKMKQNKINTQKGGGGEAFLKYFDIHCFRQSIEVVMGKFRTLFDVLYGLALYVF